MRLERIFGVVACVAVAAGLVLAFLVIGPPSHARLIALDTQRARDLQRIASGMHDRFGNASGPPKFLPSDLAARDPVTRRVYQYQRTDAKHYALCAYFALPAESENIAEPSPPVNWPHGAGRTCYELSLPGVAPRVIRAVTIRTR